MGLQKSLARADNTVKGLFPTSYSKISNIRMENGKVILDVKTYCDYDARKLETGEQSGPMPGMQNCHVLQKSFNFADTALPSPTLQTSSEASRLKHVCYLWLKTSDDFRTATDVLEAGQNVPV